MAEKRRREKEGDRDPDHEFSFEELLKQRAPGPDAEFMSPFTY